MTVSPVTFAARGSAEELEAGTAFSPKFDDNGLIPCIVSDHATGEVVMFAWMDRTALSATVETGIAHYYSRSRRAPWRKGDTSGNVQHLRELRTDCDQDVIWIKVETAGAGVNCHTGHRSCFYRALSVGAARNGTDTLAFVVEG